jgi:hypothetical protein
MVERGNVHGVNVELTGSSNGAGQPAHASP